VMSTRGARAKLASTRVDARHSSTTDGDERTDDDDGKTPLARARSSHDIDRRFSVVVA